MIEEPKSSPMARAEKAATRATVRVSARIFGVVAGVLFLAGLALSFWAGYLDSPFVDVRDVGPHYLLYREQVGPYEMVRYSMRTVFLYYRDTYGREPSRGFGVYFDDPDSVSQDSLRSQAGCLTDTLLADPSEPFQTRVEPRRQAVVATFPLRSPFSYMTGVQKAYPALQTYVEEEGLETTGPAMEVYDLDLREIRYILTIASPAEDTPEE